MAAFVPAPPPVANAPRAAVPDLEDAVRARVLALGLRWETGTFDPWQFWTTKYLHRHLLVGEKMMFVTNEHAARLDTRMYDLDNLERCKEVLGTEGFLA
jgi:hypothetical protein